MQYPVKYILPSNYPFAAPKIYFDFQLPMDVVKSLNYVGDQNMIILPYTQQWNPSLSNLTELT